MAFQFSPQLRVILAAIIWGSTGGIVKKLALAPTTMTFFRLGVPTLILFVYLKATGKDIFKGISKLLLLGSALHAARLLLYMYAYTYTSISAAVILLYTWPISATFFGWLFLKEHVDFKSVLLLLISFMGVMLTYVGKELSFANDDFLGMCAMLVSTTLGSLALIIFKKELANYSEAQTVFYQNLLGAIIFLPFFLTNRPFPEPWQIAGVSTYAFMIGIVAFILFFYALKKLDTATASMLCYVEALTGILLGIAFFNETLTWNLALGGALILGSSWVASTRKSPQPSETESS